MRKLYEVTLVLPLYLGLLIQSIVGLQEDCIDYFGHLVAHGHMYIPGPSVCSHCVCYHGQSLFCKAIYCDPPYFCKTFRIGERCCEFDCLDSEEDIAKEKERLRKRKRFWGLVRGNAASTKLATFNMISITVASFLIMSF